MTREELIDTITKNVATEFRFSDLTEIIDSGATEFIVDEVLLNFEARTCKSCKYWKYANDESCYEDCTFGAIDHYYSPDSFGCNKWEPKDE